MTCYTLSDGPAFIANVGVLISQVGDILSNIDRTKAAPVIADLDRATSLLSLAGSSCELVVEAIESGPDYQAGGRGSE